MRLGDDHEGPEARARAPWLVSERPVVVTLAAGELVEGEVVETGPTWLALRGADGQETVVESVDATGVEPFVGPLREGPPLDWPLERAVVPLGDDPAGALATALAHLGPGLSPWLLLDPTRAPAEALARARCLLRGPRERLGFAPYLVDPGAGDPAPGRQADLALHAEALARGWGSVLVAAGPAERVGDHVRALLRAQDARDRRARTLTLRLHDPRTFRVLAPTWELEGAAELFGVAVARDGARACPLCATPLSDASASLACPWCQVAFTGPPEAPALLAAWIVPCPTGPAAPEPSVGPPVAWVLRPSTAAGPARRRHAGRTELVLRAPQVEALADDLARRRGRPTLDDEVLEHVRGLHRDACRVLGDGLEDAVHDLVARARGYRLFALEDVLELVDLFFMAGDLDLDRQPVMGRLARALARPGAPAAARLDAARAEAVAMGRLAGRAEPSQDEEEP